MTHAAYPVEVAGMANIAARGIRPGEGGQRDPLGRRGLSVHPRGGRDPPKVNRPAATTDDAAPARAWTSIVTPLPVRSDCVPPDSHYERYSDSNHYPNEGVTDHGRDADQPARSRDSATAGTRSGEPPRGPNDRHWSGAIRTLPPRRPTPPRRSRRECRPGRTSLPGDVPSTPRRTSSAISSISCRIAGRPGGKKPAVFSRSSQ